MIKKKFVLIALLYCALLLTLHSCATTRAPSLREDPNCSTTVEGFFYSKDTWHGEKPAIILKTNNYKVLGGTILSIDEKSVTFRGKRSGPFYKEKGKKYKLSEIKAIINEDGEIVYGFLPTKPSQATSLELILIPDNEDQSKPIKMKLKPNESFHFCLSPGQYFVEDIFFVGPAKTWRAANLNKIGFTVDENSSNYLGDLYLNLDKKHVKDVISIPYKLYSEVISVSGIYGGKMTKPADDPEKILGEYKLGINSNSSYIPKGKSPLKINLLGIM